MLSVKYKITRMSLYNIDEMFKTIQNACNLNNVFEAI